MPEIFQFKECRAVFFRTEDKDIPMLFVETPFVDDSRNTFLFRLRDEMFDLDDSAEDYNAFLAPSHDVEFVSKLIALQEQVVEMYEDIMKKKVGSATIEVFERDLEKEMQERLTEIGVKLQITRSKVLRKALEIGLEQLENEVEGA